MGTGKSKYLTKTLYVNGLACPKSLWLAINDPERLPKTDESVRFRMDQGRQLGELARRRYPTGVLLPAENLRENDLRSKGLLEKRLPLFEAGFIHPSWACYARADVLLPAGKGAWDIIEVKSGTSVQSEYIHDVAFQRHCYTGAGLKIRKCSVLLVNTDYVRLGEVDPFQLMKEEDVTDAVMEVEPTVPPSVESLTSVAHSKKCPEFGQGETFHKDEAGVHEDDSIWKEHPGSDILDLYRGGKQALALLESGVYKIRDIPKSAALKGKQAIQHAAHSSGRVHIDRMRIVSFLESLRYPLHFLDFETTFGTAIPIFDGTRPYQQIPFQFSVHVVDSPGDKPHHHSFLSIEPKDPRKKLVEALRKTIGAEGHLVAYNQSFEMSRLEELATFLPEHADWVADVNGRFVDLILPFREFAYYNPAQEGSASLKVVLPAVTGRGYEGLEIANGGQASLAYLYTAFGTPDGSRASPQEIEETRRALERYCGQDTEGMVWIVEKLTEFTKESNG
jgi:Domain of unknown function(DUF2779)